MANANQVIVNGETILDLRSDTVTPATLQKGYTAHDKSGMNITGTLEVPATEEQTVELSMLSGNQIIQPTSGKVMRKVTVPKPATLLPENIKKDVMIGGVAGTLEAGGGGAWYVTLTPNDDGSITADKTMVEIEEAYQAGYAVYCILLMFHILGSIPIIAPLTVHRANEQYVFCGVGTMEKLLSFQFTLSKNSESGESEWTVSQKEIPQGTIPTILTSVSASSTNDEVPSAKCLYDLVGNITAQIDAM